MTDGTRATGSKLDSAVLPCSSIGRHASTSHHQADGAPFLELQSEFRVVVGQQPRLICIASTDSTTERSALFHEAGVWASAPDGDGGDLYITSNILEAETDALHIKIARLRIQSDCAYSGELKQTGPVAVIPCVGYEDLPELASQVIMANGATAHGRDILWCSQGQHEKVPDSVKASLGPGEDRIPGSLKLCREVDGRWQVDTLLNHHFGREFNALNDVCVHKQTGAILFTDPDYGIKQGFKGAAQLPNGVWRYLPGKGTSMIAGGLGKPNGIVCSPDGRTCYVTDTDYIHGDGTQVASRMGAIYAYDVIGDEVPLLSNKRLFSLVDCGAPDGIKCDEQGNIYTGTFEGVDVYSPSSVLIGKILLPKDSQGQQRGCANLVFGPKGTLFILSETAVFAARIQESGDLKGVESS